MSKRISLNSTIYELCRDYPDLPEILVQIGFKDIKKPGMIASVGRFMTIQKGAKAKKIEMDKIKQMLTVHGFEIEE